MSEKIIVVQKDGILYTITNNDKNIDNFYSRIQFIFKANFDSKDEFSKRSKLSNCYLNYKNLGVTYPENIQSRLNH